MPESDTNAPLDPQWVERLAQARALKKWPLGKLVSLFENRLPENAALRSQIQHHIARHPGDYAKPAAILGFTGTPGAGKSSLLAELCRYLLAQDDQLKIAVLAIDPSSQASGGSILGDRTRMHYGRREPRLFFRSQASNLELGGVTEATFHACRILRHLFDYIFIETVGIGQNEIDIQNMTDYTFLVMQPLGGDQIQFMKCGIMEIPDAFIVNKCDEEKLARSSYHMLRSSLKQARLVALRAEDDFQQAARDNIFLTSATRHKGIDILGQHILSLQPPQRWQHAERFYLKKTIQRRYGEFGLHLIAPMDTPELMQQPQLSYEEKELRLRQAVVEHVKGAQIT